MDDGTEVCFARVSDDGCSAAICCGRTPKEALVEAIETDQNIMCFTEQTNKNSPKEIF